LYWFLEPVEPTKSPGEKHMEREFFDVIQSFFGNAFGFEVRYTLENVTEVVDHWPWKIHVKES